MPDGPHRAAHMGVHENLNPLPQGGLLPLPDLGHAVAEVRLAEAGVAQMEAQDVGLHGRQVYGEE